MDATASTRKWHSIRRTEGSTLVEFALTSAILLALLFGVVEMCFAFYTYQVTADAARHGTRWAMVRGSTSCTNTPSLTDCDATQAEVQSYVASLGYLNITSGDVTVNWLTASGTQPTTWSTCTVAPCNAPQNQVQVTVTYPFATHIPFVQNSTLNITSSSAVVISQ